MRKPLLWLGTLALAFLVVGCPTDPPKNGKDLDGSADGKTPDDADTDVAANGSKDPLEGSVFDKEMLFELYTADMKGGEEKLTAYKKHRLADAAGKELPARVSAYKRAMQRYAEGDPEGWSAFLETLSR